MGYGIDIDLQILCYEDLQSYQNDDLKSFAIKEDEFTDCKATSSLSNLPNRTVSISKVSSIFQFIRLFSLFDCKHLREPTLMLTTDLSNSGEFKRQTASEIAI